MGWNDSDVNREIDRRHGEHGDAAARIILCQATVADRLRL